MLYHWASDVDDVGIFKGWGGWDALPPARLFDAEAGELAVETA